MSYPVTRDGTAIASPLMGQNHGSLSLYRSLDIGRTPNPDFGGIP